MTTATSKTDKESKGHTPEFIRDRPNLQLVAPARAWRAVQKKLGVDDPDEPSLRALTGKGNLANRGLAT